MEVSINELICTISEKLKFNAVDIVGIDEDDIMWKSKNDGYGITYNIMNNNIEFYFDGHKVGFISKNNLDKGYTDIDLDFYNEMVDKLLESVKYDKDIIDELNKRKKKLVLFENYEDAVLIKKFTDRVI